MPRPDGRSTRRVGAARTWTRVAQKPRFPWPSREREEAEDMWMEAELGLDGAPDEGPLMTAVVQSLLKDANSLPWHCRDRVRLRSFLRVSASEPEFPLWRRFL
mmetsp:Transcript_69965/g.176287  ORF Transcript_69965/g.176287 Transcript_69965/m.176287 type:complete len:103 (-) Transcript_69965:16-324(-)